jgi:integrase
MQTVLETIKEYLETRELREQSYARYRSLIRALPESFLCADVAQIVERDARKALERLADHAVSFNKALMLLSASFDAAIRNRLMPSNPCAAIKRKHCKRAECDPLTLDEMRAVAAACSPPWVGRYVLVRALTGIRSREGTGLYWSDVDFDGGVIHVRGTALANGSRQACGKTERSTRTIPMIAQVREALTAQRAETGGRSLVFGNSHDRPVALAVISAAWYAALETCGLQARRPYILRHSFAGLCLDKGISIRDTASLLGHASIQQLTATYAALNRAPVSLARLENS